MSRHRWLFASMLALFISTLASCVSKDEAPVGSATTVSPTATVGAEFEAVSSSVPASCPVTRPPNSSFVPAAAIALFRGRFWHGTAALSVQPRLDGIGRVGIDKVFWWSDGYDWRTEPQPDLVVTGRRLDGPGSAVVGERATHAFNGTDIGTAMLVGVTIPTAGCWEISGTYAGTALSFVVWAAP